MTQSQKQQIIQQAVQTYRSLPPDFRQTLAPDVILRYVVIDGIMRILHAMRAPRIISGYRDPVKNRTVGGAPNSCHLQGRALDLDNTQLGPLDLFGQYWLRLGGRWGVEFSSPDPNHFDLPPPGAPHC